MMAIVDDQSSAVDESRCSGSSAADCHRLRSASWLSGHTALGFRHLGPSSATRHKAAGRLRRVGALRPPPRRVRLWRLDTSGFDQGPDGGPEPSQLRRIGPDIERSRLVVLRGLPHQGAPVHSAEQRPRGDRAQINILPRQSPGGGPDLGIQPSCMPPAGRRVSPPDSTSA
jgi:hypothetical protein